MIVRGHSGTLLARAVLAFAGLLALIALPGQAQAACTAEEAAARAEWYAMPHGMEFDEKISQVRAAMQGDPVWNDVAGLRQAIAESVDDAYVPPKNRVYLVCLLQERLNQLTGGASGSGGTSSPPLASNGGGSGGAASAAAPAASAEAEADADKAAGKPAAKPVEADAAADADCGLAGGDASLGVLSSETVTAHNTCKTRSLGYAYCVTSANGGGAFSCAEGHFGTDSVGPGGTKYFSVANASQPFQIHYAYCVGSDDNPHPLPASPRWDGQKVDVTCH